MGSNNIPWIYLNIFLAAVLFYLIIRGGLVPDPGGIEFKDLITIILTAIAVLLAAVTIFIGVLAVWGYSSIREAATKIAQETADHVARQVAETRATDVAGSVAVRAAQQMVRLVSPTAPLPAATDALTDALTKPDQTT